MENNGDDLNTAEEKKVPEEQGDNTLARLLRHWHGKTEEEQRAHLDKLAKRRMEERVREKMAEFAEELAIDEYKNFMSHKNPRIKTIYTPKMSLDPGDITGYTQSPAKPKLFMEYLKKKDLIKYLDIEEKFPLLERDDFYVAHTREMVDNFFDNGKTSKILHIKWTPEYAETVKYCNAAMYAAIKSAIQNPGTISFIPATGFHHANPTRSALFCAFSGQVIASMKIYKEYGLCGAYIDLDGHYGNSIDNSREFVKDIDKAISPVCGNINIIQRHQKYLDELKENLDILRVEIAEGRINYVVFSQGADSHEWDELASQLSTEEWKEAARMVFRFIGELQEEIHRQIPLIITLCGGYRRDDYNSVLSLHATNLVIGLNTLCGQEIDYKTEVMPRQTPQDGSRQ